MAQVGSKDICFKWHRPHFMAVSGFSGYAREIESAVGKGNETLLRRLDDALNSDECDGGVLELTEERARKQAASAGIPEAQYFVFLSYLHEIEYRKSHPLDKWSRRPRLVPCPDWLPPNRRQVKAGRMSCCNFFGRLSNISLVVVVCGAFPLFVAPLAHHLIFGGALSVRSGVGMALWGAAVLATLLGRVALRLFRS